MIASHLAVSRPTFTSYSVADISTRYLTESDGRLLADGETFPIVGTILDGAGALLVVPDLDEDDTRAEAMREAGWSAEMMAILRELHQQGFHYVRFDNNGFDITGGEFPTFDW
jgi:hypothetical protein